MIGFWAVLGMTCENRDFHPQDRGVLSDRALGFEIYIVWYTKN